MKKKVIIVFAFMISLIVLNGCSNEKKEYFNCDVLNDVKMFVAKDGSEKNYLITNDGSLYSVGNYSDGSNCKKIDSDIKFKGYFKENLGGLVSIDNELYIIDDSSITTSNEKNNYTDVIKTTAILFEDNNGIAEYTGYLLKEDGNIYLHRYYIEEEDKLYKSFQNEKILDFDCSSGVPQWIKTDKAYYVNKIKNEEECNKYDDVECKYEFGKSDKLTNQYKDISFVGNDMNGNIYYVLKDGNKIINPEL